MKRILASLVVSMTLVLASPTLGGEGEGKIGLGLAANDGKIQVVLVAPESPAKKAGIEVGMIVDEIDGVATAGKSLHECAELVHGKAGTSVILKLEKPDDPTPVTIALRRE